jgi:hypothetical protein
MAGVGVEQGIAVAAPFDRNRGAVEGKAFDTPDDVAVSCARTVMERCVGILDARPLSRQIDETSCDAPTAQSRC